MTDSPRTVRHYRALKGNGGLVAVAHDTDGTPLAWKIAGGGWAHKPDDLARIARHIATGVYVPSTETLRDRAGFIR